MLRGNGQGLQFARSLTRSLSLIMLPLAFLCYRSTAELIQKGLVVACCVADRMLQGSACQQKQITQTPEAGFTRQWCEANSPENSSIVSKAGSLNSKYV